MYRHIRRGAAGFSFIELLVTIIIAGIAFAALVPVFVTASQKGQGDSARNVALNLAQDKIENIRELDYDLITQDNLENSTFPNPTAGPPGPFGTAVPVPNGGGTKTYTVKYTVTFVGGSTEWAGKPVENEASGDGSEQYKLVSVDVYWTGNPQPVKHAVLQTIVYKQYRGSNLDSFVVGPIGLKTPISPANAPDYYCITGYTITLTATVNAADVANTKSVVFRVYGSNGVLIKRLPATVPTDGVCSVTYGIVGPDGVTPADLGTRDGVYTLKATAITKSGFEGETEVVTMRVETGPPPAPTLAQTGVAVYSGTAIETGTVDLTWARSSAGDVTSYDVWRRTGTTGDYAKYRTVTVAPGQAPAFTDTGLANTGTTTYYYKVAAIDSFAEGIPSTVGVSGTPVVPSGPQADTKQPNPMGPLSVTTSGTSAPPLTLTLVWTGVTDDQGTTGPSVTGVANYYIYRSTPTPPSTAPSFATTPTYRIAATLGTGIYTFIDSGGLSPSTSYYYKVVAVDGAGNLSLPPATTPSAITQNYLPCNVYVQNNSTSQGYFTVTNPDGSAIATWTWPGEPNPLAATPIAANGSGTWRLPVGFSFKVGHSAVSEDPPSTFKPIPSAGVISNQTDITVSFP